MPPKGSKISEETRERMRLSARSRKSNLVSFGIVSEKEFEEAQAKDLKWCGRCKQFKESGEFQKAQTRCKACSHALFTEYYQKKNPELLAARRLFYRQHLEQEKKTYRRSNLRRYAATQEWYDAKLAEQGGGCAICGIQEPNKGHKHFAIDHDHSCHPERKRACDKCRRGLLCARCNNALERLESHSDWLQKAVAYLWRYGSLK